MSAGGVGPQFDTAEFPSDAKGDVCKLCGQAITGQYWRVHGQMACPACVERVEANRPTTSHALFMRALLFGAGAAVVGMIAYAAFEIATGLVIGYLALGVGWFIAKAMLVGSKGAGGRQYQIAAVLFTYFAVAVAAVPAALWQTTHHKAAAPQAVKSGEYVVQPDSESRPEQPEKQMGVGAAVATLIGVGLASPFMELQDGLGGIIGLVILFVGMRMAWQMTKGGPTYVAEGPYGGATSN